MREGAVALRPLRVVLDQAGLPEPRAARDLLALLRRFMRVSPLVTPHRQSLDDYVRFAGRATRDAAPARYAARMAQRSACKIFMRSMRLTVPIATPNFAVATISA